MVGSGVAGLSAAVRLAGTGARVGVLTKADLASSATAWAQGGIAAVLGGTADEDSTDQHLADTLAAGAGLCDHEAVRILVDEGPTRVRELIAMGAVFDTTDAGSLARAREGGHTHPRILHAGGAATGAEVERALVAALRQSAVAIYEGWLALDLLVERGRCAGVRASSDGTVADVRAGCVVLATGGAGQLYAVTTNPPEATGDGIAMALRAGVPVADVEFFQFHPTALHHPAMPRPLLSEALRGHGAKLYDADLRPFVDELAPRDVVSRAMADRMAAAGVDHLWLDARGLDDFARRFPTIAASLAAAGLDPATDLLPIAPAAHYLSGGVLTDTDGAAALPGLWAAGETACTGVHGANRLASNSLLEGMVFGGRLADAVAGGKDAPEPTGAMRGLLAQDAEVPCQLVDPVGAARAEPGVPPTAAPTSEPFTSAGPDAPKLRDGLQRAMTAGAGVLRSRASLDDAGRAVALVAAAAAGLAPGRPRAELENLVTLAGAVIDSASRRTETRGAHARREYPATDDRWRRRLVHGRVA